MIVSVKCETCKTPHHDHFACFDCGAQFGGCPPRMQAGKDSRFYKFCPMCGSMTGLTSASVHAAMTQPEVTGETPHGANEHEI